MPNGRQPLCDMTGIDDEIKDLIKKLNRDNKVGTGILNGVNGVNGTHEIKTADQDLDPDLACPANAIAGTTTKWGVGKLHHVYHFILHKANLRDFKTVYFGFVEVEVGTVREYYTPKNAINT